MKKFLFLIILFSLPSFALAMDQNSSSATNKARKQLIAAIANNDVAAAQAALENGATMDGDDEGVTPLHIAVYSFYTCNEDIIEFLLANKATINVQDHKGHTPLYMVALNGFNKKNAVLMAKFLLKRNADPNIPCHDGRTPLHAAVWAFNYNLVKLLVENNAHIDMKDVYGATPLDMARIDRGEASELYVFLKESYEEDMRKRTRSLVKGIPSEDEGEIKGIAL